MSSVTRDINLKVSNVETFKRKAGFWAGASVWVVGAGRFICRVMRSSSGEL